MVRWAATAWRGDRQPGLLLPRLRMRPIPYLPYVHTQQTAVAGTGRVMIVVLVVVVTSSSPPASSVPSAPRASSALLASDDQQGKK